MAAECAARAPIAARIVENKRFRRTVGHVTWLRSYTWGQPPVVGECARWVVGGLSPGVVGRTRSVMVAVRVGRDRGQKTVLISSQPDVESAPEFRTGVM